jgi:hypothetical protein
MKKISLYTVILSLFFVSSTQAGTIIYKQRNNQGNFVKLEKLKLKNEIPNHPYSFSEDQMWGILRSIRFSKKLIIYKEAKNRNLFEDEYIDKFTPYLMEAFNKANQKEAVIWSVVQKNPYIILRNDRLTQVKMWVVGHELHLDFLKIDAKLQGDYQAPITGDRLIQDAKGVGVKVEAEEGQKFAIDSTDQLILDLNQDWVAIANRLDAEDQRLADKTKHKRNGTSETASSNDLDTTYTPPPPSPVDQRRAQDRLTELKQLKDKGLISEKDYEKKKEEILKGI